MEWLSRWIGRTGGNEPLIARVEELPGLGQVRIAFVVDCMGAMCPRPQLLTMKIVAQIGEGDVIEVVSDNPAAVEAFPTLAETLSCTHLMTVREKGGWRMYLRKGLKAGQPGLTTMQLETEQ